MSKGGDQRARAAANGKKVGRPPKPQIPLDATAGIATRVLAMDGAPDHKRKCECAECKRDHRKNSECVELKDGQLRVICETCRIRAEHAECHCEVCGWWESLIAGDRRLRMETRKYLTDRRDGKPAQGVFLGDTREGAQALERGNAPSYFGETSSPNAAGSHKPN